MKLYIKIAIHAIFWFVYLSYSISVSLELARRLMITNVTSHLAINIIWAVVAFYSFYIFVIGYFERGKYFKYLAVSFIICLLCAIVFLPFHFILSNEDKFLTIKLAITSTIGTFLLGQCGSLIRGFENWVNNLKHQTDIENLYLKAENNLLKSQISPHFLFNSLNNIDSFIGSNPRKASEMLISLSEILRYIIYETKTDFVEMGKEIGFIQSYISLQLIRIKNPSSLKVSLPSSYSNQRIVPLILLPFIENIFKHANFNDSSNTELRIDLTDKQVTLYSLNNFTPRLNESDSSGLGLENVKRRLDLLYKNKHQLTISKTFDTFEVQLVLDVT
ncbi:MAG: hypothetical protein EHM93_12195 [Bacteroidales bacterium]|nr:MAG: hypothetical protein EHM93_12195 [Bacteroidales bacterium]